MEKGSKHTPETLAKLQAAKLASWQDLKYQIMQAVARRKPEARAKIVASWTPERRLEWSKAHRGDKNPMKRLDVAAKSAAARKGKGGRCGDRSPSWKGGISREPYAWTFDDELKGKIHQRDGHQCQLCGVPQSKYNRKLDVHHIDYDKRNSDPVNLVALCRGCNARVNANREYWTAFFQAMMIWRITTNQAYWKTMLSTAS